MDQAPVGIVVVDMDGTVSDVNAAALQILGSPDREATSGLDVLTMPRLIENGVSDLFRRVIETGEIIETESPYVSRWGKEVYLRSKLNPRYDDQGRQMGAIQILEDVSEQKRVEEQLVQQLRYEHALALASRTLLQTPRDEAHQQAILDEALSYLVTAAQVGRAFVIRSLTDSELGDCLGLVAEACAPGVPPHITNPYNLKVPMSIFPEVIHSSLQTGHPVGGSVAELWRELPDIRDRFLQQPLLSTQWFPIFSEGRWWGFVGFDDLERVRQWNDQEVVLLQTAADIFGSALQRWQAERALQQERDALEARVQQRTAVLERRLQMERVLATAAARLMAQEDFGEAIVQTLQEAGQMLDAVEALIVRIDVPNRRILDSYRWQAPDLTEMPFASGATAEWFRRHLLTRKALYFTDVAGQVGDDAVRENLLQRSMHAIALYPLIVEKDIVGVFHVALRRTLAGDDADDTFAMLDVMANLLNGLLQRQVLIESREKQILEQTRALSTVLDAAMLHADATELSSAIHPILAFIKELSQALTLAAYERKSDGRFEKIADYDAPGDGFAWLPAFRPSQKIARWMEDRTLPLLLNIEELAEMTPFSHEARQTGVGMIVPIRAGQHFDGLLFCYRSGGEQYSTNQVAMTTALADYMRTVIENFLLRRLFENTAIIEERQRFARDLHDSVSQSLYGVMLFARAGKNALEEGEDEALAVDLTWVETNALQALKEMRLLLYQLQPLTLEQGGLALALQQRFEQVEDRLDIETALDIDPDIPLSPLIKETLYRLASEALNNALKHAEATRVAVRLVQEGDVIILTISDSGRGFDPQQASVGMGLANMRFRAEQADGSLSIESTPERGTLIRCTIPLQT